MALVSLEARSCDLKDVTFRQLLERYGTGQDITVVYEVAADYNPSSRDWVGLYKADSHHNPSQYLAFEWAPNKATDNSKAPLVRRVNFLARYIHVGGSNTQYYQFLYVGRQGEVKASSTRFLICDNPCKVLAALAQEAEIEGVTRECGVAKQGDMADSLEDYEVIPRDYSPTDQLRLSEPARRIHNHISLSGSFEPQGDNIDILKILDLLDKETDLGGGRSGTLEVEEESASYSNGTEVAPPERVSTTGATGQSVLDTGANGQSVTTEVERGTTGQSVGKGNGQSVVDTGASGQSGVDMNNNVEERALVPYCGVGSLAPVYNAFWQSHLIHERLKSLPVPFVVPTRHGLKMRCQSCHRRKQEVRSLKDKASSSVYKYNQLRKDVGHLRDSLDMKSALLQKLSDQVKYLVQENSSLSISNQRLVDSKKTAEGVAQCNQRLQFEIKLGECKTERMEAENRALHLRKETLLGELEREERERQGVGLENESLRADLESVTNQYQELERHLDDVMYTLSLQGYTSLVDTRGAAIDLTKATGSLVDLEGWNIATSRKTEKCLQRVKVQETEKKLLQETVERLMDENGGLIRELEEKDLTIGDLGQRVEFLTEMTTSLKADMGELELRLREAVSKSSEGREALLREKKNTSQLMRTHQDKVNELELRITSLQDCVESTRLTNKRNNKKKAGVYPGNRSHTRSISVQTSSTSGQLTASPPSSAGARPKHPFHYGPTPVGSRKSPKPAAADSHTKRSSKTENPQIRETKYGLVSPSQPPSKPAVTFEKVNEIIPMYRVNPQQQSQPAATFEEVNEVEEASSSSSERSTAQNRDSQKESRTKKSSSKRLVFEYFSNKGRRAGKTGTARHGSGGGYPEKVVQVNDLCCYHCGLTFLPGSDPNYIQRHIDSHTYM